MQGIALGKAASIGSVIVIELAYEAELFMLGRVTRAWHVAGTEEQSQWMGTIRKNDEILVVERLKPWSPGSGIFEESGEEVKVFIDDIRMSDVQLKRVQPRARSSVSAAPRFELLAGVNARVLQLISVDAEPRNPQEHPDLQED